MPTYSVSEAKDNLSRLIDQALAGEDVVITRHGKQAVRLRAEEADKAKPRKAMSKAWSDKAKAIRDSMPKFEGSWAEELDRIDDEDFKRRFG
jgi:prevent-host-death family protein